MSAFYEHIRELAEAQMRWVNENREQLLTAWIAETGLKPSESVLIEQRFPNGTVRIWIERRTTQVPVGTADA